MVRRVTVGVVLGFLLVSPVVAQATGDARARDGVRRAALDYLEGFYEGDSTKFLRAVRPDFYKIGFERPRDATNYSAAERMTLAEALDFIRQVSKSKNFAPTTAPKQVVILEVMDQTAAARVTAWWGTDYLLMGKYEGQWMISHVLWQSPPPSGGK